MLTYGFDKYLVNLWATEGISLSPGRPFGSNSKLLLGEYALMPFAATNAMPGDPGLV